MSMKVDKFDTFDSILGKEVFSKGRIRYICQQVRGKYALLVVKAYNDKAIGYEVHKLRLLAGNSRTNNKPYIRFACNEEFGHYGWFYNDEQDAIDKFLGLSKEEVK